MTLSQDQARTIQVAALARFGDAPAQTKQLTELLTSLATEAPRPFVCVGCGVENAAERISCQSCRLVSEPASVVAARMLAE